MIRSGRRTALLLSVLIVAAGCSSGSGSGDDGASPSDDDSAEVTAPMETEVDVEATVAGDAVDPAIPVDDAEVTSGSDAASGTDDVVPPIGGEPVSIIGIESVEIDMPVTYELSPDGRSTALPTDDLLCLFAIDDIRTARATPETATACVDDLGAGSVVDARWSQDSTKVVFGTDTFRMVESAPVQVLGLDGSVVTIAEPMPGDDDAGSLDGAPFHPVFVDGDTVAFGRVVGEPATFEVTVVDLASGDERLSGTIPRTGVEADTAWLPRWPWESSDGQLLVTMGGFAEPVSLWTLDLESGEATEVEVPPTRPDADTEPSWTIHDRTGRLGLVVDLDTMMSRGGRSDSPAWWLYDFETGSSASVGLDVDPASDDDDVRFAAISPDEATIAVVVVTRGDGGETLQLLATATGDVLAGNAEWTGVELPEGAFGAADLTESLRALSWDGDLVYKDTGAVHVVVTG